MTTIPSANDRTRVKFPLAAKLIFATATLVALIAVGFVATGLSATQEQYKQAAERLKRSEIGGLTVRGLATARNMANGSASSLLNGDLGSVRDLVNQMAGGDTELLDVLVVRPDWNVMVARSSTVKPNESIPAALSKKLTSIKESAQLEGLETLKGRQAIAFAAPIQLAGRLLGYLYLEVSTARVEAALAEIETERQRAFRNALLRTVIIGSLALGIGVLVAVIQGWTFSRSIGGLTRVAMEVGRGNLQARAVRTTNDEIGVLCDSFNEMTGRIENLLTESVAKAALDKEVERANAIQNLLMPPRTRLEHAGFVYCGTCETATQMGGDWWAHYPLGDDRVLLTVGDVTGHGIPSAMLTASAKAACDTLLHQRVDVALADFMHSLDHVIRESGKGELVMTLFAAVFDRQRMVVDYVNAGHNFPLLFRGGTARSLIAHGGRLGDGADFTPAQLPIESNDVVVLYTDGIIECQNDAGQEYGVRRFRKIAQANTEADVITARDVIMKDAYKFFGKTPRQDDITLVVCRT